MNKSFTWAVQAQIETVQVGKSGTWSGSRQVPTFYITDIITSGLAETVALEVLNPLGLIPESRIHVTVARMDGQS